jgi:BRCT domain type II-containing protein
MLNKSIVFCFTGKGPMPRSQMEAMAINSGASVTKSITNATTILVIMDMNSQSTKARKARANGIDLIGPETFFAMCNSHIKNIVYSESKVKIEKQIIAEQVKKPLRRIIL